MLPSAGANVVHFSALDTQALALSTYAFALIFALDKLADADFTDKNTDAFIYTFMGGLGILIGFAWEQAFPPVGRSLFAAPQLATSVSSCASTGYLV